MSGRQPPPQWSGPPRAAIYCRVSSSQQEDNSSLGTQEERCRAYAAEHGWTVVAVYREVHSGAELFERPQLTLLRESMRRHEFDVLLVYALDRLSRKQTHQGLILSEAEHAGVLWDSVTEDIDDSPQGQILRAIIGGMAEMERLKIIERTQRGIRARAEAGKLLAAPRPLFGYRWHDETRSRLDVDPERGLVVQRIYREFLEGKSLRSIGKGLAETGVPTPTGQLTPWSAATISLILKNPAYAGRPVAFRYRVESNAGGGKRYSWRPVDEQLPLPPDTVPALVTEMDQAAALARLEQNKAAASRNNPRPEATLLRAGLVRCGYCGSSMIVKHPTASHPRVTDYRCAGTRRDRFGCPPVSIAAAPLDRAVWERVTEVLLDPEVIAVEVERRRATNTVPLDLGLIDRQLHSLDRKRQNLIRSLSLIDDSETAQLMTRELTALSQQHKQLQTEREALLNRHADAERETEQLATIADWCSRVATNLECLSHLERRSILEALGVTVRVWKASHNPRWELTMTPMAPESDRHIVSTTTRRPCDRFRR